MFIAEILKLRFMDDLLLTSAVKTVLSISADLLKL